MSCRPSSPRLVALVGLIGLTSLGLLSGCGAEDEQQEARYPQGGAVEETPRAGAPAALDGANAPGDGTEDIAIGVDGEEEFAENDPSALTTFKPTLDKYGSWEDDGTYGTVWYPSQTVVGSDFAPYVSAGHWVYDDDYVWVSDYDWGWAPFHYGRWVYIGGRGWAWIPGRRYAGAWVAWRTGYDGYGYVGWAPLPPTWYWRGGYAYGLYAVPPAPYVFCASHDVFAPAVGQHVVVGPQVPVIAANTRPYVPASPGVGGSGRVPASPGVGGPPPGRLGFAPGAVPHAPAGHVGLLRAQQVAHPLGGREGIVTSGGRAPIVNGTRTLGSGASGASGPVYSSAPTRLERGLSGPQAGTPPTFSSSSPSSAGRSSSTFGGGQSFPSSGSSGSSFHSSSSPSFSSGAYGGGGSHFGGGGGGSSFSGAGSSPSFHSSSPSSSYHYSAPSGGGAMHAPAAPSRPATHTGGMSAPRHR
jgi:hypothetical protein